MKDNDDINSKNFDREMSKIGVSPLKKRQEKVMLRSPNRNLNQSARKNAASVESFSENNPDHYSGIEWLGPHDLVEYKRDGIQHQVFKDLKQGRITIDADLDLHSYRVDEAKIALFQFIQNCVDHNIRHAMVIHGKGWHGQNESDERKSVSRIKSYTVHWLKTMDTVLAFSSAQARDGGAGALYVLLKRLKQV